MAKIRVSGVLIESTPPQELADGYGLDLNTYALARMIASEEGDSSVAARFAVGEAARNYARRGNRSISRLLLKSKYAAADGFFGEQAGRWASTAKDAGAAEISIAEEVIAGSNHFPEMPIDFFSPGLQATGKQGTHTLRVSVEEYIRDNARDGMEWIGPRSDIDAGDLMLFRYVGSRANPEPALNALKTGNVGGEATETGKSTNLKPFRSGRANRRRNSRSSG